MLTEMKARLIAMNSHEKTVSLSKEQGKRLVRLRNLANLSRKNVSARYGINVNTYTNWELGVYDGLSKNAVSKISNFCQHEGIIFSIEWLLYGVGEGPHICPVFPTPPQDTVSKPNLDNEEQQIISELLYFREHHKEHIDMVVSNDSMEPRFMIGEYVAGIKYYREAIDALIDKDCIVQTKDGKLLLRKIKNKNSGGHYTLTCNNPNTKITEPVLYDVELISAAPVLWQRRKAPS
jgi:HTH-type transcriptional regulator, cell division transcriptional repressor